MKIHENSAHYRYYRFLWRWTFHTGNGSEPYRPKNICQYIRWLFFGSLYLPFCLLIMTMSMVVVEVLLLGVNLFLFIWRSVLWRTSYPYRFKDWLPRIDEGELSYFYYRPIKNQWGFGAWVPALLYLFLSRYLWGSASFSHDMAVVGQHIKWPAIIIGTIVVIFIVIGLILEIKGKIRNSESCQVLVEAIKAKKRKICPLIEVIPADYADQDK